jgi:hypothetical protein
VSGTRKDVLFLSVDIGDEKSVIEKYWQEKGFTMRPMQQKGDAVSAAFGVQYYPTNILIGPDGKILWRAVGWNEKALRAALSPAPK